MNYKKIDAHLEGDQSWSYIDTVYGDSIGIISFSAFYELDNSGENYNLIYYHKANGQRWGAYNPIDVTTAVTSIEPDHLQLEMYPNPAINQLYFKTENLQPENISILDVDGRLIYTSPFKPEIDISQLSAGVYFVEVNSNAGLVRKRFIKM